MKKLYLLAILMLPAAPAAAQTGFYVSGSLGGLVAQGISFPTTYGNGDGQKAPGTGQKSYDPGLFAGLALGYRLPYNLRVEGELGYGFFQIGSGTAHASGNQFPELNGTRHAPVTGGDQNLGTVTAAAYYDLPVSWKVVPYIGAGGGYYHLDSDVTRYDLGGNSALTQGRGYGDGGLMLGEIGATWHVAGHWSVVPAYRYEHLFAAGKFADDLHIFKLGARYDF